MCILVREPVDYQGELYTHRRKMELKYSYIKPQPLTVLKITEICTYVCIRWFQEPPLVCQKHVCNYMLGPVLNVLEILPIIPSLHFPKIYYWSFFFYSHIVTNYSCIIPILFISNITSIRSQLNTPKITQWI